MIPGTSHEIKLRMPFDVTRISDLTINISQNGFIVIKKTKDECRFNRQTIRCELSPEETIRLKPFYKYAKAQAVGKMNTGRVFKVDVESFPVEEDLGGM